MTITDDRTDHTPEIWAIGGGKGGTGKTFVATQLAIYLASKGLRVILVDADFGGANIHSFFGIKKVSKTIGHFFEKKEPLEHLVVETGTPNLRLVPGDYHSISSGSLNYAQKTKLFRHIRKLDADFVLLDLGAGTSNDTIDAFLLADRMLVVGVPEITATENLFQFVKSAFFRKLKAVLGEHKLKNEVRDAWMNRKALGIKNIVDLLIYVKMSSAEIESILARELEGFSLHVILNQVRNAMEIREGFSIRSICIKYIGIDTRYVGYIEYDFQFWKNLSLIQNAATLNISYSTQKDIMKIAENVLNGEQMKISSIKTV